MLCRQTMIVGAVAGLLLSSASGDEPIPLADEGPRDYRANYAVIVGVDHYSRGQGLRDLRYAANDTREFRKLLVEEFGYDDAHILYLTDAEGEPAGAVDGPPTQESIRDAFDKSLAPTDSEALDVLALCHAMARQRDSAVQAFNEADRIATGSVFSSLRKERLDRLRRNDELQQLSVPIGEVIVPVRWSPGRKAEVRLLRGIFLASEAKRDDAVEAMKAATSWARTSGDPRVCNKVSWNGPLRGFAREVLAAGEAAWDQSHNIDCLDTLAVARALSGDRSGAVRDLKQVVEFLNLVALGNRREYLERRSSWLRELSEGRNPFDQKAPNSLLNESND
jgi:hypothetical protein